MKMKLNVLLGTLFVILEMIHSSDEAALIGMEVMEMEDLLKINHLRNKVGSLEYGDACRNSAVEDVTSDVCFKSNPFLQCVDDVCMCAYVRIDGADDFTHKQMQYFRGKCRGLENFPCFLQEHCGEGLTCESVDITNPEGDEPVAFKSKGRETREFDNKDNLIMEDNVPGPPAPSPAPVSTRGKFSNRRQKIVKAKLEILSRETLEDENKDNGLFRRLNGSSISRSGRTPGDGDVPDVSNDLGFDLPMTHPPKKMTRVAAIQKPKGKRACIALSTGNEFQKQYNLLKLSLLTTLFHISVARCFV